VRLVAFGPEEVERRRSVQWTLVPQVLSPGGGELCYEPSAWGHPTFPWSVRMKLRQKRVSDGGAWSLAATWTERGLLDETGNSELRAGRFSLPLVATSIRSAGCEQPRLGAE
jgi:hypothetical protein